MSILQQTRFKVTVNHSADLPDSPLSEIAFAGRSNAGKSTAINVLCEQKRLAFSSKTPGRTQHINFFSITNRDGVLANLIDLPGYGYARVGEEMRAHWEQLLSDYIQTRSQLCGLVIMMDARRPFTDLDHQMVAWFLPTGKPLHILLTKADKLTRSEATLTLAKTREILTQYQAQNGIAVGQSLSAQLFSATKRTGLDEARKKICTLLNIEIEDKKKTPL
ncbi:MAG: YihA family ribosome biogenesis GTP-binding protein [Ottowia sp.]|nr:YihA family ribosome biogenesis GTP-binding protein [Ottowia sp.]